MPLGNGSIGSSSIEKVIVEFPVITIRISKLQKWLLNSCILWKVIEKEWMQTYCYFLDFRIKWRTTDKFFLEYNRYLFFLQGKYFNWPGYLWTFVLHLIWLIRLIYSGFHIFFYPLVTGQLKPLSHCCRLQALYSPITVVAVYTMAVQVVEFSNGVYKIRKIFA